ncbi:hypothetical protein RRG08_062025 [Elysia crispata]|uniref:C2H2-type domain-containing protein n=1 Tax=Elysia crispata TaxID=231223 RepID=A0AAE1DRP4_9GAST|nr:hypothetical protein RRG08_062025 [Elysia crispata]
MSPTTVNSPVNTGSSTITSNSSSSSNNNNKQPPNDNGHATNNSSGTSSNNVGSSHTSPNNLDLGNRSPPQDLWRSTSSGGLATIHGLDLSKPPSLAPPSCLSGAELIKKEAHCLDGNDDSASATTGLDLSKPELPSPGTGNYRRPSDLAPSPFTNGVHSDPPTPQGAGHAPSRSMSSGSGADNGEEAERSGSPFGADSVLNDRSAEGFTNGDTSVPLSLSSSLLGAQPDRPGYMKSSPKFADPYSAKAFDEASPPPPLKFKDPYSLSNPPPPLFDHSVPKPPSSDALHKLPTNLSSKYKDSCIAARLADNTFVKPLDSYSKLLEGYGHNARNNNNNNNTSNNNNTGPKPDLHDSPFGPIPESYAKHIENLANGYKTESSPLGKDGLLFKGDPPLPPSSASSIVNFSKREGSLTNGIGAGFGVTKSESGTPASAHSPGSSSSSLPSILNFSTNHLRGMAAGEGGLAGYLSSYSMGGPLPGSLSGSGGGSGGDSRPPGGGSGQPGGGSEGGLARASPNNKLACRFCGKTFSQAGYIKAHERLHTGEKPFACSVCGKRFSDPSNWKKHERVHANNKKAPGTGGHVTGLDHSDSKHRMFKSPALWTQFFLYQSGIFPLMIGPLSPGRLHFRSDILYLLFSHQIQR